MQRYFSHICDGTDVQADWRSCTHGRAPNAIDISQGSLTCPSYTDKGPPFVYDDSDTPPHLVPFTTRWGYGGRILESPASSWGDSGVKMKKDLRISVMQRLLVEPTLHHYIYFLSAMFVCWHTSSLANTHNQNDWSVTNQIEYIS